MNRRTVLQSAATLATPLVAGCSGGGDGGADTTTTTTIAAEETVEMVDNSFEPKKVKVRVGDGVRWVNDSDVAHTVTATQFTEEAKSWEFDERVEPGDSVAHTFDSEAVYEYYCTVHGKATMCGVVLAGAIFNTPAYAHPGLPCESDDG